MGSSMKELLTKVPSEAHPSFFERKFSQMKQQASVPIDNSVAEIETLLPREYQARLLPLIEDILVLSNWKKESNPEDTYHKQVGAYVITIPSVLAETNVVFILQEFAHAKDAKKSVQGDITPKILSQVLVTRDYHEKSPRIQGFFSNETGRRIPPSPHNFLEDKATTIGVFYKDSKQGFLVEDLNTKIPKIFFDLLNDVCYEALKIKKR
jgi:hypothetical protein